MPPRRTARPPRPGRVRVEPADAGNAAADAVELIDDEAAIARAIRAPGPAWEKLVANLRHFIEDVLEGWANEGRTFPSEAARGAAIGALVTGTIEKIRRDPKKWVKEHWDR